MHHTSQGTRGPGDGRPPQTQNSRGVVNNRTTIGISHPGCVLGGGGLGDNLEHSLGDSLVTVLSASCVCLCVCWGAGGAVGTKEGCQFLVLKELTFCEVILQVTSLVLQLSRTG